MIKRISTTIFIKFPVNILLIVSAMAFSVMGRVMLLESCCSSDLETGLNCKYSVNWDLEYCSNGKGLEFLKVIGGALWARTDLGYGEIDFEVLDGVTYGRKRYVFYNRKNSPSIIGRVYLIRTLEGNYVKLRVLGFYWPNKSNLTKMDCFNLKVEYEIFFKPEGYRFWEE